MQQDRPPIPLRPGEAATTAQTNVAKTVQSKADAAKTALRTGTLDNQNDKKYRCAQVMLSTTLYPFLSMVTQTLLFT
jgi:hypothetical protein